MKLCNGCRRHVRASEGACPFCGEGLPAGVEPRLGAVVLLGALAAACADRPLDTVSTSGEGTSSGAASTSGSSGPGPTSGPTSTTTTSTGGSTSSSSGELTTASDPDSGDNGCAFYGGCPTDAGDPFLECDPWFQDCPEGQKCMPYSFGGGNSWTALKCVPVAPDPKKPGEACTVEGSGTSGLDDCELGAMCWGVDAMTLMGQCVAMCTGQPDAPICAGPAETCLISGVLNLCLPNCDPLAQDCPASQVCVFNPNDPNVFLCVTDASGEGGQEFDDCEFVNACDAGLLCASPALAAECDQNVDGCCLKWCDMSMPTCTGMGAECIAWFDMGGAPMGLEDLGFCGIPQ